MSLTWASLVAQMVKNLPAAGDIMHGISSLPEDTILSPVLPQAPSPYSFTLETFSDHPHPQAEDGEP